MTSYEAKVPRPFVVNRISWETKDTFTLETVPIDGGSPLAFEPGQFTMLSVPGVGEIPISISGSTDAGATLVQTIRAVGSVTGALSRVKSGDCIGLRGPFGTV